MLRLAMPRSPFNRAVAEIVLIFSSLFRQMVDGSVSVLRSFSLSTPDDLSKKNCATGRRCMGREVFRPREPSAISPEVGTDCTCTFGRAYLGPLRACLDWCPAKILAS